ncbi:NADH dehydrogenase [ubiquinone] flavoprotein 3, mitochondrial [Acomys russatus]|uniref:NADH dehydrogenase [ubiquinone] flavoprotein 3, mitochondrial n=1 Tax=Acomys russatus TaxID=60746 RepID=UPI0021E255E2|nr:NADH dehydrogenase [ubiquinone] flavoprotein 3, mitochondrial [Acomys russatus]
MAVSLLLRGGRIRALKPVLLEARVFRELASTVPLSTESGKSEKGTQPIPKKQSAPKDVVGAEERGKLLATHTAAALSKSTSPPGSYPSVENTGGAVAGLHPGGSRLLTDEGLPKRLSRKTLVEFPQKVPSPPRARGSDSEARQKVTGDSPSSSSSSSSDSDSDGEEPNSDVRHQVASKGKAGFSKPEASRAFENAAPKITAPAKEKPRVQKPHTAVSYPEKSLQPKKKGTFTKLGEDHRETRSRPATPSSRSTEISEENVEEEPQRGKPRPNKTGKERPKPFEAEGILLDHTKTRPSAQLTSGPVPTMRTQEDSVEQLPAAAPGAGGARHLEPEVPEPEWKAASPVVRKESLEKQVPEGRSKAKEETLEDQKLGRYLKTVPAQKKDTFDEKAGPQLEGQFQEAVGEAPPIDAGPPQEIPDDTQEPAPTDTSTYKNLQHHDYHTYTFLDLNLDLSKFRMPQPSSGRESPWH